MENQTQTSGSMKQSVSMTSLPPPGPQEVSDMAVAKMRLERPYNSLKVRNVFSFRMNFSLPSVITCVINLVRICTY